MSMMHVDFLDGESFIKQTINLAFLGLQGFCTVHEPKSHQTPAIAQLIHFFPLVMRLLHAFRLFSCVNNYVYNLVVEERKNRINLK